MLINEIVTDPVNDWGHSDGMGNPFDGMPGVGEISASDEYIELYNAGSTVVDLTGWTLEIHDDVPDTSEIMAAGVVLVSAGSTLREVQPGAYVLIGDPPGTVSNDVYLVLRDAAGSVVDDVEIGGLTESLDTEGDGVGDGAPAPDQNGSATGSFDEAVMRIQDSQDSDVDQADFEKGYATPLAANDSFMPPDETEPPTVLETPSGVGYPATLPLRVTLSESIRPQTLAGNVEVSAGGAAVALGDFLLESRDRIVTINPVGRLPYAQLIRVTLRGGSGGITDLAGNPLSGDVTFQVTTEAGPINPGMMVINEICASPVQDWDDSTGGDNMPFSEQPGTGAVSSEDEWVELYVASPIITDVSGYSLVVYNGPNLSTPSRLVTPLSSPAAVVRVVGTGTSLSDVQPGDRIIIGNPRGAILADSFIEIRDSNGVVVDAVEIGGNTALRDRGGDGVMNGAPEPGEDGNSSGLADETIARVSDGVDTGDDVADFVHSNATLGAMNP